MLHGRDDEALDALSNEFSLFRCQRLFVLSPIPDENGCYPGIATVELKTHVPASTSFCPLNKNYRLPGGSFLSCPPGRSDYVFDVAVKWLRAGDTERVNELIYHCERRCSSFSDNGIKSRALQLMRYTTYKVENYEERLAFVIAGHVRAIVFSVAELNQYEKSRRSDGDIVGIPHAHASCHILPTHGTTFNESWQESIRFIKKLDEGFKITITGEIEN